MELDYVEQVPTILTKIAEGKKVPVLTMETKIEEFNKWIKLLLWLDKLKVRIKHFAQKAFPLIPPQEPFIKV